MTFRLASIQPEKNKLRDSQSDSPCSSRMANFTWLGYLYDLVSSIWNRINTIMMPFFTTLNEYLRRAQSTIHLISPYQFQLVSIVMKVATCILLFEIWHAHKWFVNNQISEKYEVTRDIFLNDCVYVKNYGVLYDCHGSSIQDEDNPVPGVYFSRDHGFHIDTINLPSISLKMAGYVYYFLMLSTLGDFVIGCGVFLVINKSNALRQIYHDRILCAHKIIAVVLGLIYNAMGLIIFLNRHNALTTPQYEDELGETVYAFAATSFLFQTSVVLSFIALKTYKEEESDIEYLIKFVA